MYLNKNLDPQTIPRFLIWLINMDSITQLKIPNLD